jgi:HEPN domain-containing protein
MAKVLPVAEKSVIRRLLRAQAMEFDRGATQMYEEMADPGDSAYFLRLLSIELYFKLLCLLKTESLIFGHDLREIYDLIPRRSRDQLFQEFSSQPDMRLELEEFREWLRYLGNLFVNIRYPFEEFRQMSLEEYEERITAFETAPPGDFTNASIVYHMDRVDALTLALRNILDSDYVYAA